MSGGGIIRRVQRAGVALGALWLLSAPAGQAAEAPSIPIQITAGHIVAPITVRGQAQQAVLDTGAPRTLIDEAYAESLGMGPGWLARLTGQGRGKANGVDVQSIRTDDIAIAGWSWPASVGMTDLGVLARHDLPPVILGADFFEQWVVELDFDAKRMILHPREDFQGPLHAVMLPVSGKDHHYTVPVSIEGAAPRAAHIDLGAQNPLMLDQAYAASVGVLDGRRISSQPYTALGTHGMEGLTAVREVQLAAFVIRDVPTSLPPQQDRVFGTLPINLGLPLLSRFHVWMDLGGGRMWLSPRPGLDQAFPAAAGQEVTAAPAARNLWPAPIGSPPKA
jgi:hypothetical protein